MPPLKPVGPQCNNGNRAFETVEGAQKRKKDVSRPDTSFFVSLANLPKLVGAQGFEPWTR